MDPDATSFTISLNVVARRSTHRHRIAIAWLCRRASAAAQRLGRASPAAGLTKIHRKGSAPGTSRKRHLGNFFRKFSWQVSSTQQELLGGTLLEAPAAVPVLWQMRACQTIPWRAAGRSSGLSNVQGDLDVACVRLGTRPPAARGMAASDADLVLGGSRGTMLFCWAGEHPVLPQRLPRAGGVGAPKRARRRCGTAADGRSPIVELDDLRDVPVLLLDQWRRLGQVRRPSWLVRAGGTHRPLGRLGSPRQAAHTAEAPPRMSNNTNKPTRAFSAAAAATDCFPRLFLRKINVF
eukprot:gene14573-biopygen3183